MKTKDIVQKNNKSVPFVSILLGIAVIATTSAYLIFKFVSERTYRKKWEDYDDCGIA